MNFTCAYFLNVATKKLKLQIWLILDFYWTICFIPQLFKLVIWKSEYIFPQKNEKRLLVSQIIPLRHI